RSPIKRVPEGISGLFRGPRVRLRPSRYIHRGLPSVGLGLKGRLQLAFGAITLLVVIATGVGLYAFFQVGKSLQRITEEALPPAVAAGGLSIRAEFIVSVGPTLLASTNVDEINRLSDSVAGELINVTRLLDQLRRADLEKAVLDAIGEVISNLGANLALL